MAKKRGRNISGILILDKPEGESSNYSLQQAKRLYHAAKAGHTGSLDPLATGVLPLCFGEATKISQFLLDSDKAYRASIKLGIKTDSGDSQGTPVAEHDASRIDEEQLQRALVEFRGEIEQIPSMYSALKHKGVPLYKLAREGKTVERKRRKVCIHRLELIEFNRGSLVLDISCSKGTYIRTLTDDLGDVLGVGAHVTALRRTRAGPFVIEQARSPESIALAYKEGGFDAIDELLVAADLAVQELPALDLPFITADYIQQGQAVIVRHAPTQGLLRLYRESSFIGIGEILDDGRVAPKRLFVS
jgi:tRNA pseudouridine55 synthase